MPLSAIIANNVLRQMYSVQGKQHHIDYWIPSVSIVGVPNSANASLVGGASNGTPLSTIQAALTAAFLPALSVSSSVDGFELYSVSHSPYYFLPLYSESVGSIGTNSGAAVLGASARFVMKAGIEKTSVVLNELTGILPPSRSAPPSLTGAGILDKLWQFFKTSQYFSLRTTAYAASAFRVSSQFNKKLLKMRSLR